MYVASCIYRDACLCFGQANDLRVNFAASSLLPHLRVLNSPSNQGDQALFLACSLASFATCYFQSDSILNDNLDALYVAYVDAGAARTPRIVAAVTADQLWSYKRLQFENTGMSLIIRIDSAILSFEVL